MMKPAKKNPRNPNIQMVLIWFCLILLPPLNTHGATTVTDTIPPPPPDFPATISGLDELCQGTTAQYFADIPIDCQTQWLVDGVVQTSASDTLEMQWTTPGIHMLELKAVCDTLTTSLDTPQVTVIPIPQQPSPIMGNSEVCLFAPEVYTTQTGDGETCQWFIDGELQSTMTNVISYVWNTTGNHLIEVLATNTCGTSDAASLPVGVFEMPSVDLGNDTTILEGQVLVLDAGNPGCNYLWSTGATTQTITVTQSGLYEVQVSNGCGEVSDEIQVQVIVGKEEIKGQEDLVIKISGRRCEISIDRDAIKLVRVFDGSGILITETINQGVTLPHAGVFILQLTTTDGRLFSRKLAITE